MNYAYLRVSSKDQNLNRQRDMLKDVKDCTIYEEKASGKDFERPEYNALLSVLKRGDVLYILSIDRLGRNYEQIISEWKRITREIGADIVVLDMPLLDTRSDKDLMGTLISDIVLQLLSYVAQTERENIRTRQEEGIKAAKKRGVQFGRKTKAIPCELIEKQLTGQISVSEACRQAGISRSLWYKNVRRM